MFFLPLWGLDPARTDLGLVRRDAQVTKWPIIAILSIVMSYMLTDHIPGIICVAACGIRAVPYAVEEVGVAAKASRIRCSTSQIRVLRQHVVQAYYLPEKTNVSSWLLSVGAFGLFTPHCGYGGAEVVDAGAVVVVVDEMPC